MSSEWPVLPLQECLDALIDYRGKTPEKTDAGIPLITAKIIKSGHVEAPAEFIAVENYDAWMRRGIPRAGDVVLTVEAPLGEVAQLGPGKVALAQRVVTLRGKPGLLDSTYLLYLLQSEETQQQLQSRATGTTVPGITQSELRKLAIKVPPLPVQVEAAAILKTLDRRITLLRETNATLHAIAQALFKSWFVDFDPVRARMEGRMPDGMEESMAALFPDTFEETALGQVPRGWSLAPFGSLLACTIGGDWGSAVADEKNDRRATIIRGTDIPGVHSGATNHVPVRYTSTKKLATRTIRDGDIVLEASGGSKRQPTGRSLYITDALLEKFTCPVVPASFCRLLRPASKALGVLLGQHLTFIYAADKTWEYQNHSTGIANLQITHFLEKELVVVPDADVLAAFAALVRPIVERVQAAQISELSQLRDTLLSRIISGRVLP